MCLFVHVLMCFIKNHLPLCSYFMVVCLPVATSQKPLTGWLQGPEGVLDLAEKQVPEPAAWKQIYRETQEQMGRKRSNVVEQKEKKDGDEELRGWDKKNKRKEKNKSVHVCSFYWNNIHECKHKVLQLHSGDELICFPLVYAHMHDNTNPSSNRYMHNNIYCMHLQQQYRHRTGVRQGVSRSFTCR